MRYEGIGEGNDKVQIREPDDAKTGTATADAFTVDDAVEYLGFGKFQLILSFFTGIIWSHYY